MYVYVYVCIYIYIYIYIYVATCHYRGLGHTPWLLHAPPEGMEQGGGQGVRLWRVAAHL